MVEKIARGVFAQVPEYVMGDVTEEHPLNAVYILLSTKIGFLIEDARCSVFPALAIRRNSPRTHVRRRRIAETYDILGNALFLYTWACCILNTFNSHLLPDVVHIQFFFALAQGIALLGVKLSFRDGAESRFSILGLDTISEVQYLRKLKRMRGVMLGTPFNPAKHALRSFAEFMTVMMIFFSPSYVFLRWFFAGDPLPVDVDGPALLWRLTFGGMMAFLWMAIRMSNQLTAQILDKEIHALEASRMQPVSA
jgi:hypothetical protein